MIFKNYYKLLDLPRNVKSTQDEIKTAYIVQAKKYHPDVNIQNKAAEERFKDIILVLENRQFSKPHK